MSLVQNCAPRKCISSTVLIGCECMIFTFGVDKLSRLVRVLWVLCLTCNCKRIVYRKLFLWYLLSYSSLVFTEAVVFILQLVWAKKFPQAFQMITSCKRWKERHFFFKTSVAVTSCFWSSSSISISPPFSSKRPQSDVSSTSKQRSCVTTAPEATCFWRNLVKQHTSVATLVLQLQMN